MEFPLFNSLELSDGKEYDLNDPAGRHAYFNAKLGHKIEELKGYLEENTFVGFLLAKKQAGKGTYSKMFAEIVGEDRFAHISVGDSVRKAQEELNTPDKAGELKEYIYQNYRGFVSVEDAIDAVVNHTQDKLIPTELILTLLKREIQMAGRKGLFIDGLPRNLDQVSYSLYFRDLINFRYDPDFFVLIDVPESIIRARMDGRLVCPKCHTSRHLTLNPTKFVSYDTDLNEFYLVCDNSTCSGYESTRLVGKRGDDKGIEHIRERLDLDAKLIQMATNLHGIPRVELRNAIPVASAAACAEDYELKKMYEYEYVDGVVEKSKTPWIIRDDNEIESYSLMAATVVVSLFSQIHHIVVGNKKD